MCGIIGVFQDKIGKEDIIKIEDAMEIMKNRGKDGSGLWKLNGKKGGNKNNGDLVIGHLLHSIVGEVMQPLENEHGVLAVNCEIYNWQELNEKYKLNARNDSELLFFLLNKHGVDIKGIEKTLKLLDGVYAFVYFDKKDNKLILCRDIIGIKPIWYSFNQGFSFASEKKVLEKLNKFDINELNPRQILELNLSDGKFKFVQREFFNAAPLHKHKKDKIKGDVIDLFTKAVRKRVPDKKFGILFSGGIDSTYIAHVCSELNADFTLYTAYLDEPGFKEPEDLVFSKRLAKEMGFELKIVGVKMKDIEKFLKIVVPLIEDSNVVKVEVALTLFLACEHAAKDGCKVIFSGLGSEEIFAGYNRHKESSDVNKECLSGLIKMYERDLYRDDVVAMYHGLELRLPFLDKDLVEYALKIHGKHKLSFLNEIMIDKVILREAALHHGVPNFIVERPKKAAQYGSNFDKALRKIAKTNGMNRSEYLMQFYPGRNVKLAALVSGGKDSIYAMHVMMRQNYEITCMVSIKSINQDSYMFHTPNIELVKLQSEAIGIPLIFMDTKGEKEKELVDLAKALTLAKKEHQIEGVVTGALYSNYQRERIEKICDKLGLKIFAPLWHLDQEQEMREILNEEYKIMFSSIAADGLDKSWVGREITEKDVDKLVKLNEKIGLNVAGEGGEFESLVVDGLIFNKKIEIEGFEIVSESKNTARMDVKEVKLVDKFD
ncbi:diphthine--ammonia ligase [Nanoarchaeota archaeon]